MMRIVISANTSWYLFNFRKNTILMLIKKGFEVFAVSPKDEYCSNLEGLGVKHIDIFMESSGTNPIKDFNTYLEFRRIYKKLNPDVILNFTPKVNIYSTLAAKSTGSKVINNIAGLGVLFINDSLTSRVARKLYKISQKYAFKVFFQNEDDRTFFLKNDLVAKNKTERLPGSGADLKRFKPCKAKDDGVVRFLLTARMLYDKGIGQYVEAAKYLKEIYGSKVEFNLLGFLDVSNPSAVKKSEMDEWVSSGFVNYLGTSDNVDQVIAPMSCVVLPSYYREGVPKSLLEAGAMGKPIITTDNVGCRETVDHGVNGFLCEPRSADSLIEMLKKFIELDFDDQINLGLASRKKIENEFDEKIVLERYFEAICE